MPAIEMKLLSWIEYHRRILFVLILSVLALLVRGCGLDFISNDALEYLLPWFEEIRTLGGLQALGTQVGNYNIPYQILICLISYLPFEPLSMYKGISILFDYALAAVSAGFYYDLSERKSKEESLFIYAAILFLPTVIMNSAVWGQCDSIYVTFVICAVWFLIKERYRVSFVFLGLAFSFKLQAVFVLPFFLIYYCREQKFSILNFAWIPAVDYALCIPAFLAGRGLLSPVKIYLLQSEQYSSMWLKFPSFWALIGDDYTTLKNISILLTVAILGTFLMYLMFRGIHVRAVDSFVFVLCWSVWTVLLFLPAMHERYGFMLDILMLILAWKNHKYVWASALQELCSVITYGRYLFGYSDIPIAALAACYVTGYVIFTCMILKEIPCRPETATNVESWPEESVNKVHQ